MENNKQKSDAKKQSPTREQKKKNGRQTKPKPISANELLNTQPSQPQQPQQPTVPQMPQPQGQPQPQFVFNTPAGFVPVVPMMAPIYNFTNAPVQGQPQQFYAAMPFGAHQPPVPGAPINQMPQQTQAYPMQPMAMPIQYSQQIQAQPSYQNNNAPSSSNSSAKTYNKNGSNKKQYQEKSVNKGKDQYREGQKDGNQVIYQKYKTTLCRHYEDTQTCQLGPLCSFAHGKNDLRHINDPMPKDFQGKKSQIGALHSNYRTQMCRNWEQTGVCKFAAMCCFAHGKDQMRNMIDPVPQRTPENLLFPPHLAHRGGSSRSSSRHEQQQYQDDSQGINYFGYADGDMTMDYPNEYSQQEYSDMQPQDYQQDVYWNQQEQHPQFFTGAPMSAPVWQPLPEETDAKQPCNQQQNESPKEDYKASTEITA